MERQVYATGVLIATDFLVNSAGSFLPPRNN